MPVQPLRSLQVSLFTFMMTLSVSLSPRVNQASLLTITGSQTGRWIMII